MVARRFQLSDSDADELEWLLNEWVQRTGYQQEAPEATPASQAICFERGPCACGKTHPSNVLVQKL